MEQRQVALIGFKGHSAGELFLLESGRTYTVGRSRTSDISFRRLPSWKAKTEEERERDGTFRTVSGKHFAVTVHNLGHVVITNLSRNGTQVNNRRLEGEGALIISDLERRECRLRFGLEEEMVLRVRRIKGAPPA